jgi:hypothetical protein
MARCPYPHPTLTHHGGRDASNIDTYGGMDAFNIDTWCHPCVSAHATHMCVNVECIYVCHHVSMLDTSMPPCVNIGCIHATHVSMLNASMPPRAIDAFNIVNVECIHATHVSMLDESMPPFHSGLQYSACSTPKS